MYEGAPTVTLYHDGSYHLGDETDYGEHREIVIYWPNGDKKFVGYLRNGLPVKGRWFFKNMNQYVGELKDGQLHGEATYIFCNGFRYDGGFKNSQYHGTGKLTKFDQLVYEGDFKDGKYHGEGRLRWDDGRTYVGEFRNGLAHGEGTLYDADGDLEDSGRWIYGALVKSFYA